jgi:hypothetical protein
LQHLIIKYKFGDPNWEREEIDQLVNRLRSSMSQHPNTRFQSGYISFWIEGKDAEVDWRVRVVDVDILEGGDESDD